MNERVKNLREFIFNKKHHSLRRRSEEAGLAGMAARMAAEGLSYQLRAAVRLKLMLRAETPVFLQGERIVVTRTVRDIPDIYTEQEG